MKIKIIGLLLLLTAYAVSANQVSIHEGEDYAIPSWVKISAFTGYGGGNYRDPRVTIKNWGVTWRQLEPERGCYNWDLVDEEFRKAKEGNYRLLMRLTNITDGFAWAKHGIRVQRAVPDWVKSELNVPIDSLGSRNGVFAFELNTIPPWHSEVESAFNKLIHEFGKRGYPQRDELAGAYIHGISTSRGEEFFMELEAVQRFEKSMGLSPEVLRSWGKNKIDAFAEAFSGVEHKLAWVGHSDPFNFGNYRGIGNELLNYAYAKGAGNRGGGIEWYYRHRNKKAWGSFEDDNGYMYIDESHAIHAKVRYFGEENEEYDKGWFWRWGPHEMYPYRYRMAMMHALSLRFRFIWTSGAAEKMNLPFSEYSRYSFGKNIDTAPDAWAYLWEGYMTENGSRRARNFERWLIQRDVPGGMTQPTNRVEREYNPGSPGTVNFDFASRRTDIKSDNPYMYFDLDDNFKYSGPVQIKVEIIDNSDCRWRIDYNGPEAATPTQWVENKNDGKIRTITFTQTDVEFRNALDNDMDFRIVCDGPEDLTVQWVRFVRMEPISLE